MFQIIIWNDLLRFYYNAFTAIHEINICGIHGILRTKSELKGFIVIEIDLWSIDVRIETKILQNTTNSRNFIIFSGYEKVLISMQYNNRYLAQ